MNKRNISIDALRILSIVWILLFHAQIHYGLASGIAMLDSLIGLGACGCTVFFVLSGYLLRRKYKDTNLVEIPKLKEYLKKRMLSIYPSYVLFLIICILMHYRFPDGIKQTILLIPIEALMIQTWFSPAMFGMLYNDNFWFISVLAFMYLIFPIINSCENAIKCKRRKLVLVILVVVSWIVFDFSIETGDAFQHYYANPLFRIPEFIFGVVSADVVGEYPRKASLFKRCGILFIGLFVMERVFWPRFVNNYNLYNLIVLPMVFFYLQYSSEHDSFGQLIDSIIGRLSKYGMAIYLSQSASIMLITDYKLCFFGQVIDFVLVTIIIAIIVHVLYEGILVKNIRLFKNESPISN